MKEAVEGIEEPVESEPFTFTAEELLASGVVDGIEDVAVLQGSTDIDLLAGITYDESVVTGIAVKEEPSYDTEGEIEAIYTVTLNGEELAACLELSENDGVALPEGEVIVEVPVRIEVVSAESAAEWLTAHPDMVILTDGNEVYDPSAVEETEESSDEAQAEGVTEVEAETIQTDNSGTDSEPAQTGNSDKNTGSGSGSGNSGKSGDSGSGNSNKNSGSGSGSGSGNSGKSDSGNSGNSGNSGSSGNSNKDSGSGSGNGNKDSGSGSGTSQPAHTHSWEPVYKTVHHDEEGHSETVVVEEAWDEPIYETQYVCNGCGKAFGKDLTSLIVHIAEVHDDEASYGSAPVQVGTKHHDAVTEQRWVVDQSAWDEQVVTGYKCSCGETKGA